MYYHVAGRVILAIEADTDDQARAIAEEWGHETVFDFTIEKVY